jgi:hypothetical protein
MKLSLVAIAVLFWTSLSAAELRTVSPEQVGFSAERLAKIQEFTRREIEAGHGRQEQASGPAGAGLGCWSKKIRD